MNKLCKRCHDYHFVKVRSQNEYWASKHYLKKHQLAAAQGDDALFIVLEQQKIIGIARLVDVTSAVRNTQNKWLRGLFISPEYRHSGLATALLGYIFEYLQACEPKSKQNKVKQNKAKQNIFAFAEPHLKSFYEKNAFALICPDQLPVALQQYWHAQQQGKHWIIIQRQL